MKFVERLEALIKERKLTKSQFLNDLGFGKNQISQWKNGTPPFKSTIDKIAQYFNVSIEYLTGESDVRGTYKQDEDEAIKVALFGGDKEVTPEMWQEVKDYIEFIKHKYFKDDDNAE